MAKELLETSTCHNGFETHNIPESSRTFLIKDILIRCSKLETWRNPNGFLPISFNDGLTKETESEEKSTCFKKDELDRYNKLETNKLDDSRKFWNYKYRINKFGKVFMDRRANVLFLLLRILRTWFPICLFLFLSCVNGREQKFAIEPQDQSAVVGSRVTLPCRIENKSGQLQWTKDDFGLGTHRHLSGYERYMMIGSDEEGDYSLDIRAVNLDDDGLYQCQVSTGPKGEAAIRSRYARLIILAPPDPPRILQGPVLEAIEEREVKLECVSVGGKPAAEITWVDHDGGVLTQGVTYKIEPMPDGHRFTARSTLRLKPKRHHHNQTFTCQAQNTADRAYRAASIQLEVKYAPKVKLFVKTIDGSGCIAEGDRLTIGCNVDANPEDVTVKWFVNNEEIISNNSKVLVLPNVSRKYNDATVRCEVFNAVGKSSASKSLEVTYGPSFIVKPQNVESEIGSTATLTCLVDGYPRPEILWIHYDHDKIIRVGKSSNLTVNVTPHTAGLYWCKATVEGFPEIEAQAQIFIKGPPKIISNKTQYGVAGDSIHIECVSFAVPKPDYVLWSFAGHEINSLHNHDYTFLEEPLPEGIMKSTLIIHESYERHFGRYNCSVVNLYGTDSIEIHLIPKKSFRMILIISAVGSAVGLAAVVLLLILICHRLRRKHVSSDVIKKPDVTDIGMVNCQYKESDRSSNISDLKLELRHVEGSCEGDNLDVGCETEFHTNMHLTSKLGLGLPLAGPVSLPNGYDNELMKHYHRYSQDYSDTSNLHFKVHNQSNGYVPYVDYSKDYVPPIINSNDTPNGSMVRGNESMQSNGQSQNSSLQRLTHGQSTGGFTAPNIGPDVIPMSMNGIDVRYAATYGNLHLRNNQHLSYGPQVNTANPAATPAPPPYYTVRNTTLPLPTTSVTSPSSSSSSRPVTSPMASSSSTVSSVPLQVKLSPQIPSSLYVLPQNCRGSQSTQITSKGNGVPTSGGTHV